MALLQKVSSTSLHGILTDEAGRFTFQNIPAGSYTLSFSFVGYASRTWQGVTVTESIPAVNIGKVLLSPAANQLQEVKVTGDKLLIEDQADRLVYNAEIDISNVGGNAGDVLRKVPSLAVDGDGNVQLRGSANVRVLINGKPSTLFSSNLADALKQIPSDMIKSVEVMTSPSTKYDAEGSAGIINIILKKNALAGVSGSVGLTAGNINSNGYGNLNVRRNKLGINLGLNGFHYNTPRHQSMLRTEREGETELITTQSGRAKVYGGGASAQLGIDYDLDSLNLLSVGIRLNTGKYRGWYSQLTQSPVPAPYQEVSNYTRFLNSPLGTDINLDYTHIFKPQQELTLLALFSQNDVDNFINQDQQNAQEQLYYVQRNTNANMNREITLQSDYTQAFSKASRLEVGAKLILRKAESNAQYLVFYPLENQEAPDENLLNYQQNVLAGYVSYRTTLFQKYMLRAGARYEQTYLDGDFTSQQMSLHKTYRNLIPSLNLSRNLTESQTLKLSYTQRLQRPHIFLLNPYRDIRDPKNVTFGNPALEAELTHLLEAGYSTFFQASSLSASVYLRQTNNSIQTITLGIENGVAQNTYANTGKAAFYGISLSGSTKLSPAWSLNGNIDVAYSRYTFTWVGQNQGWQYSYSINTSYTIGNGWSAQAFGSSTPKQVTLQGRYYSGFFHGLTVQKELFEKKGSLSVGINNPFSQSFKYGTEIETPAFSQENETRNLNRGGRISFSYKFGKQDKSKGARSKKSIQNDDLKQGAGN